VQTAAVVALFHPVPLIARVVYPSSKFPIGCLLSMKMGERAAWKAALAAGWERRETEVDCSGRRCRSSSHANPGVERMGGC
jgi:hypothetical protein